MPKTSLTWTEHPGGHVWSAPGQDEAMYQIIHLRLDDAFPTGDRGKVNGNFLVRRVDPASLRAHGAQHAGYPIGERYTLAEAMSEAEQHHWGSVNHADSHVPENLPATARDSFFWPISEGVSQGALVLRHNDKGRLEAQVLGMTRGENDKYGLYVLARVEVPGGSGKSLGRSRPRLWGR